MIYQYQKPAMQIYVRWVFFERKQVKLTIIWNEKISRNKQILTLKKLYPELNKVSTVEIYKITKKTKKWQFAEMGWGICC
mgnify:CR=1 FL=1